LSGCIDIRARLDYISVIQETQLSLTNRATRLEVSQGHQTWYHSTGPDLAGGRPGAKLTWGSLGGRL